MAKQWMAFVWFVIIASGAVGLILSLKKTKGTIVLRNTVRPKQPMFEQLLDAIEQVESGGDSSAVGDNGKAVGAYQIHKIYVDDVNRIYGTRFTYEDRWDKFESRELVRMYVNWYIMESNGGSGNYFRDIARIHNGGPNGYKKECTKAYWEKVKAELERK